MGERVVVVKRAEPPSGGQERSLKLAAFLPLAIRYLSIFSLIIYAYEQIVANYLAVEKTFKAYHSKCNIN